MGRPACSKDNCPNPSRTRGMCHSCYMRWHSRETAYGRFESRYVDAVPAREHVLRLRDQGMSLRAISIAADVSYCAVRALLNGRKARGSGPSKEVGRVVAEKLLAVTVPPPGTVVPAVRGGDTVDATGTVRRLRALVAFGYDQAELCERLGWPTGTVHRIVTGRSELVTARSHRETAALFAELQLVPGTSGRARAKGERSRWALPLQWDEETIDDPAAQAVACRSRPRRAA